jgi:ubiquinone/menaquinone biosynthesis C-methylase UbiE/uncharacterized protein YbaR (Trm112 family)
MNIRNMNCPSCKAILKQENNNLICVQCSAKYKIKDGIPIFTSSEEYWCNVDKEKMNELIADADQSGDWLEASKRHIPDYMKAYSFLYRADAQFIFPINSQSRVLDAGSMWGGLTVPIAQYCKEIVALDKTWETLRLLKTRATQMDINNIIPIVSPIHNLPFPDNHFDFVMLNGVLEWLGMEQDVVLDEHWDKKRKDTYVHKTNPREMQLEALKELHRVCKPNGSMYIAIENRVGVQYFFGHPDDHMNVRFTTFMPRWYANTITKFFRNAEYRTYIYTPNQLSKLVHEAAFKNPKMFSVYPHYGKISRLTPFDIFSSVKRIATEGYSHIAVFLMTKIWRLFPFNICKYISPSLALIADAGDHNINPPRLLGMLAETGIISNSDIKRYELMIVNYRFGNGHTINYVIFDKNLKKLIYFCKISRRKGDVALKIESENLEKVSSALKEHNSKNSISKLLFFGEVDGINLQVSEYMDLDRIGFGISAGLRRIDDFIPKKLIFLSFLWRPLKIIGRTVWFHEINREMYFSIRWLATFQKQTKSSIFNFSSDIDAWLDRNLALIGQNNISVINLDSELKKFKSSLEKYDEDLHLCMQHGDFDLCNLLRERKTKNLKIVDFEHLELEKLPFFDLGNLIFSPLLTEWKGSGGDQSLKEYATKTGWSRIISKWLDCYCECSGISRELLSFMPGITVIEQNAKQYPENRDPYDYPLYGDKPINQMLGWRI